MSDKMIFDGNKTILYKVVTINLFTLYLNVKLSMATNQIINIILQNFHA